MSIKIRKKLMKETKIIKAEIFEYTHNLFEFAESRGDYKSAEILAKQMCEHLGIKTDIVPSPFRWGSIGEFYQNIAKEMKKTYPINTVINSLPHYFFVNFYHDRVEISSKEIFKMSKVIYYKEAENEDFTAHFSLNPYTTLGSEFYSREWFSKSPTSQRSEA